VSNVILRKRKSCGSYCCLKWYNLALGGRLPSYCEFGYETERVNFGVVVGGADVIEDCFDLKPIEKCPKPLYMKRYMLCKRYGYDKKHPSLEENKWIDL